MSDVPHHLPPISANAAVLRLFAPLPPLPDGRARDPYMEAGCHPDVVGRLCFTDGGPRTAVTVRRLRHGGGA